MNDFLIEFEEGLDKLNYVLCQLLVNLSLQFYYQDLNKTTKKALEALLLITCKSKWECRVVHGV